MLNSDVLLGVLLVPYLIVFISRFWSRKPIAPLTITNVEYIDRIEYITVEPPIPSGIIEKEEVSSTDSVAEIQKEIPLQTTPAVVQSVPIVGEFPEDIENYKEENRLRTYFDIIDFVNDLPSSAPFNENYSRLDKVDIYKEMNLSKVLNAKDVMYLFGKYKMGWSDRKKILVAVLKTKMLNDKEKERDE